MAQTENANRIDALAQPKKLPQQYYDDRATVDRRSLYWVDRKPYQSEGTTEFACTPRVEELSAPKKTHRVNPDHRDSPIWPVKEGAKKAEASPRVEQLAEHKEFLARHGLGRSPYTEVSEPAQTAEPSDHTTRLATPKTRESVRGVTGLGEFDQPLVEVSEGAANAKATLRVEELAAEKKLHPGFVYEREVIRPVSENAKNAAASGRILQLARHKTSLGDTDEYDPYVVTLAARRAKPAPRVVELATPLPRKCRSKKI